MKRLGLLIGSLVVIFGLALMVYNGNTASLGLFGVPKQEETTVNPVARSSQADTKPTAEASTTETVETKGAGTTTGEVTSIESQASTAPVTETTRQTVVMTTREATSAQNRPKLPATFVTDQNGKKIKLSQLSDKPMVINFWASWCPPCKIEMPYFQEAYDQYNDKMNFVMLNATQSRVTETEATAAQFVADAGYTFPIYYDVNYMNQIAFSITSLPSTIVFDSKGEVVAAIRGGISRDQLFAILEEVE